MAARASRLVTSGRAVVDAAVAKFAFRVKDEKMRRWARTRWRSSGFRCRRGREIGAEFCPGFHVLERVPHIGIAHFASITASGLFGSDCHHSDALAFIIFRWILGPRRAARLGSDCR
jgi:hypothetical protein